MSARWPNSKASEFVTAGGVSWHVQRMGSGPALLLVHGTGAATHSWRHLAPMLAARFTVIAPDLPGHGFSGAPPYASQMALPSMANALSELLSSLSVKPVFALGHSAGAAIIARMTLDRAIEPRQLFAINGALQPLSGMPGILFPPAAKLMASSPLCARLFAKRATDGAAVQHLIRNTGSTLDAEGVDCYAQLIRHSGHVSSTLQMMAQWDLRQLVRDLPSLKAPLMLVVGGNDLTLSPLEAQRVRALLPSAEVITLPGLGHLAHEENPQAIVQLIEKSTEKFAR